MSPLPADDVFLIFVLQTLRPYGALGFYFADHLQTFRPYGAGPFDVPLFYKHPASTRLSSRSGTGATANQSTDRLDVN